MSNLELVGVSEKKKVIVSIVENKEGIQLIGQEKLVDQYVEWDKSEALAKASKEEIRKILDAEAVVMRLEKERAGIFAKSVFVRGKKNTIHYTFKNAFSSIPANNDNNLKKAIGQAYPILFTKKKEISIKKGTEEMLVELLGEKASLFLETKEAIVAVPEFMEKRFSIRNSLSDSENECLDELTNKISQKPSLACK